MSWYILTERENHVRWKLKSHYAKKTNFWPFVGWWPLTQNIHLNHLLRIFWENNLFDSDSLRFDLIKNIFRILCLIHFPAELKTKSQFFLVSINVRSILYWQNLTTPPPPTPKWWLFSVPTYIQYLWINLFLQRY